MSAANPSLRPERGRAGSFGAVWEPEGGLGTHLSATHWQVHINGLIALRWVLSKLGLREGDHLPASRSKDGARVHSLAAGVARHLGLCSASAVARHFHRAKATLSERLAACRQSPEDRAIRSIPLVRIVKEAIDLQARLAESPQDAELTPHLRTTR